MLIPIKYNSTDTLLCVDTSKRRGSNFVYCSVDAVQKQGLNEIEKKILDIAMRNFNKNNPLYAYTTITGKDLYFNTIECTNNELEPSSILSLYMGVGKDIDCKVLAGGTMLNTYSRGFNNETVSVVSIDSKTDFPVIYTTYNNGNNHGWLEDKYYLKLKQAMIFGDLKEPLAEEELISMFFNVIFASSGKQGRSHSALRRIETDKFVSEHRLNAWGTESVETEQKLARVVGETSYPPREQSDLDNIIKCLLANNRNEKSGEWYIVMAYLALSNWMLSDKAKYKWLYYDFDIKTVLKKHGVIARDYGEFDSALALFGCELPEFIADKSSIKGIKLTGDIQSQLDNGSLLGIGLSGFKRVNNGALYSGEPVYYRVEKGLKFSFDSFGARIKDTSNAKVLEDCYYKLVVEPEDDWATAFGILSGSTGYDNLYIYADIDRFVKANKLTELLAWYFNFDYHSVQSDNWSGRFSMPNASLRLSRNVPFVSWGISAIKRAGEIQSYMSLSGWDGLRELKDMQKLSMSERAQLRAQVVKGFLESLELDKFNGSKYTVGLRLKTYEREVGVVGWILDNFGLTYASWLPTTGASFAVRKFNASRDKRHSDISLIELRANNSLYNMCGICGKLYQAIFSDRELRALSLYDVKINRSSRDIPELSVQTLLSRVARAVYKYLIENKKPSMHSVRANELVNVDGFLEPALNLVIDGNTGISYTSTDLTWLKEYVDNFSKEFFNGITLLEY